MAVTWLKTGKASQQLAKQDAVAQEKRRSEMGKMFRFFLKPKDEARVTFVDGELSPEGFLLPPRFYEHNLMLNGKWGNYFVCPQETSPESGEKCPICEGGDRPSLVALFTIIDHRMYKSKDGKQYKDQPRLYVAKPTTFELLNKLAAKRGGLAGCTFDISRLTDKDAAVGGMFDFVEKKPIEELQAAYTREFVDDKTKKKVVKTIFVPANYDEEITYRSGDELRKMGLGASSSGPSVQVYVSSGTSGGDAQDYSEQL